MLTLQHYVKGDHRAANYSLWFWASLAFNQYGINSYCNIKQFFNFQFNYTAIYSGELHFFTMDLAK